MLMVELCLEIMCWSALCWDGDDQGLNLMVVLLLLLDVSDFMNPVPSSFLFSHMVAMARIDNVAKLILASIKTVP